MAVCREQWLTVPLLSSDPMVHPTATRTSCAAAVQIVLAGCALPPAPCVTRCAELSACSMLASNLSFAWSCTGRRRRNGSFRA
eukprot:1080053-Pyramimonas_sp.AAC.1